MADGSSVNGEGRPLTPGEIDDAKSVFGDAIDYDQVRVFDFSPLVGAAETIGNDIFYPEGDFRNDFSTGSLSQRADFIHELAHVFQGQNDIDPDGSRIAEALDEVGEENRDKLYDYSLDPNQDFLDLNPEAQAEVVRDKFFFENLGGVPDADLQFYRDIVPFEPSGGGQPGEPVGEPSSVDDIPAGPGSPPSTSGAPPSPANPAPSNVGPAPLPDAPADDAPPATATPKQPSPEPAKSETGPTLADLLGEEDELPQGGDNTREFGPPPPPPDAGIQPDDEEEESDDDSGDGPGEVARPNPDAEPEPTGGTVRSPLDPAPEITRPAPEDGAVETDFGFEFRGPVAIGPNPNLIRPSPDGGEVTFDLDPGDRGLVILGPDPNLVRPSPEGGEVELDLDPADRRPIEIGPNPHLLQDGAGLAAFDLEEFDFEVRDAGELAAVDLEEFNFKASGNDSLDFIDPVSIASSFDADALERDISFGDFELA